MIIKVLGAHNLESKRTKLVTLLVDDIIALDAGGLTSSLTFRAQQKLKAVLLTHGHYDHIRDIPALGINALLHEKKTSVYSTKEVRDIIATYLLNGTVYSKFLEKPEDDPTIRFTIVEPLKEFNIGGYTILPVPVPDSLPAVGYQVTSADNKTIFYTGDTGPGISESWQYVQPHVLFIETTAPNRYEAHGRKNRHLTPSLLKVELEAFQKMKGYLPFVVLVHMNPNPVQEKELAAEVATVAEELSATIVLGYEGMVVRI